MREIDITHIGEVNHDFLPDLLDFTKKSQAIQVIEMTDFIKEILNGEEVTFVCSKTKTFYNVNTTFVFPLLDAICANAGEQALDLFNWSVHGENFLKKYRKKLQKSQKPIWTSDTKVVIPDIGYELKIQEDWTFNLKHEYRNKLYDFLEDNKHIPSNVSRYSTVPVTIFAGSVLSVDRVYIRKGVSDYSSVTFYLISNSFLTVDNIINIKTSKRLRFFASLKEVNQIVCQWNERSFV